MDESYIRDLMGHKNIGCFLPTHQLGLSFEESEGEQYVLLAQLRKELGRIFKQEFPGGFILCGMTPFQVLAAEQLLRMRRAKNLTLAVVVTGDENQLLTKEWYNRFYDRVFCRVKEENRICEPNAYTPAGLEELLLNVCRIRISYQPERGMILWG